METTTSAGLAPIGRMLATESQEQKLVHPDPRNTKDIRIKRTKPRQAIGIHK